MDILKTLCELTDDKTWKEINGPDSGCGIDYWFRNKSKDEAYANSDQGYLTISVNGENIWSGEGDGVEDEDEE